MRSYLIGYPLFENLDEGPLRFEAPAMRFGISVSFIRRLLRAGPRPYLRTTNPPPIPLAALTPRIDFPGLQNYAIISEGRGEQPTKACPTRAGREDGREPTWSAAAI